jgi:hypothetical protein
MDKNDFIFRMTVTGRTDTGPVYRRIRRLIQNERFTAMDIYFLDSPAAANAPFFRARIINQPLIVWRKVISIVQVKIL